MKCIARVRFLPWEKHITCIPQYIVHLNGTQYLHKNIPTQHSCIVKIEVTEETPKPCFMIWQKCKNHSIFYQYLCLICANNHTKQVLREKSRMNPSKRNPERDNLKKTYICWVKNILFKFLKYFKTITSTIFAEN